MSLSALSVLEPSTTLSAAAKFLPPPRQIRFVSTDGQPQAKRRRINAACLTCRRRKTRCSGERPECKTCTENDHICAGYADRSQRKESDRGVDDGNDDTEESGSSSPKRLSRDTAVSRPEPAGLPPAPGLEHHSSTGSASSHQSVIRDDDMKTPGSNQTAASSVNSGRNRVPYFRYFGPTAIVPGFKQMVVQMKDHRQNHRSMSGESQRSGTNGDGPPFAGKERQPLEIMFYDATNPAPNAPLITHLCETFFTHLGCNYPFLQRERFMRDLEDRRVDGILVDAVCAVAARFSSDPTLSRPGEASVPLDQNGEVRRAFRGHPFARRAMAAVIDTFQCPTIAVAQACLLLSLEEFGTDYDSGLWMYLGTSIRMAQDLGIQKLEGMQLEGRLGPTPKTAKHGTEGKQEENRRAEQQQKLSAGTAQQDAASQENRRANEQERIDTFWAIFFVDRVVSSGVGRPVTLRDKDIEISFPYRPDETAINGYPHPFPPLIRIVHMYGRIADVLNNIKDVNQVTPEILKRLAGMEKGLTGIYQQLSPRLHFNATNFQHYVKAEQGTNFILLHFWFHTLIILLHQPTLLHSFEGRIQQLFPDSRELSMSSAKTIADILAFAELIDIKSFIGNPFTSQPMYIAACAFLAEAAAHTSQPPSRHTTPSSARAGARVRNEKFDYSKAHDMRNNSAKHTLLATAANQNYQRCYKALEALQSYWAGTRYILTALDQKSQGLMDPLLYTSEDVDGEMPSTELSFTTPGWRRSSHASSTGPSADTGERVRAMRAAQGEHLWSPRKDYSNVIGWSLTGSTNSPAPNISLFYPTAGNETVDGVATHGQPQQPLIQPAPPLQPLPLAVPQLGTPYSGTQAQGTPSSIMPPPGVRASALPYDPVSTAEADLLLGLHSPYPMASTSQSQTPPSPVSQFSAPHAYDYAHHSPQAQAIQAQQQQFNANQSFSDMFVESQDIDLSNQMGTFAFPGGEMIPWLEYLPQDVLSFFGDHPMDGEMPVPPGLGPSPRENV